MKRILALILTLMMTTTLLAGCGGTDTSSTDSASTTDTTAEKVFKVGVSGPTTGASAEAGTAVNVGIQMAIDEVNDRGGLKVDGEQIPVEAIYYDSESNAATGLSNAEKLITTDKVDFLWADTYNSAVGIATMELAKKYDIVMATLECVSSAISQKVAADPEGYKYFFKFAFDSDAYGRVLANTILNFVDKGQIETPNMTVAIAGDETDYGRSNLESAKALMEEAGYTVVSENYWEFGATDLYSVISDIKNSNADVLLSCSTTAATGVALIKQLTENGLGDMPHMAIYFPTQQEFTDQIGNMADGLLWTPIFIDLENDPLAQEFNEMLMEYCGETANIDYMEGYDYMMRVFTAIENAGTAEPAALSAELLSSEYQGYSGNYKLKEDTHSAIDGPGYIEIRAAQIQDGKSYVVYPEEKATAEFIPFK